MDIAKMIARTDECAALLTALANRSRLEIMCHLLKEEMAVGAIAKKVGLSQSALSQHLAKLRAIGVVSTRRDRQNIYYTCSSQEARILIGTLCTLYAEDDGMPEALAVGHAQP